VSHENETETLVSRKCLEQL